MMTEFKRRITPDQLNELNEEQKKKLREWWKPQICDCYVENEEKYCLHSRRDVVLACYADTVYCIDNEPNQFPKSMILPLLDIGQMIEILNENFLCFETVRCVENWQDGVYENLCDSLWSEVKAVLK